MKRFLVGLGALAAIAGAPPAAFSQATKPAPTFRFLIAQDTIDAYNANDLKTALKLVTRDIDACAATKPKRDECVTVIRFGAYILRDMQAWPVGEELARIALSTSEKHLAPDDEDLARSYTALAEHLTPQRKLAEAETMLRKALAVREKAFGTDHKDTALSALTLANHLALVGRLADAAPFFRQAFLARKAVLPLGDPGIAFAGMGEADSLFRLGRLSEAEAVSREVIPLTLATADAAAAGTSKLPPLETRITAAAAIAGLANNLARQGRLDEAEAEARRALEMRRGAVGENNPYTAFSYGQVARLLQQQGKIEAAETMAREAVRIGDGFFRGRPRTEVAGLQNDLAAILADRGQNDEARALFERSLKVYRTLFGPNHPDVATGEGNLASLALGAGDYTAARQGYERALVSATAVYGANSPRLADLDIMLGRTALSQGDRPASLAAFEAALRLTVDALPATDGSLIVARAFTGVGYLDDARRVGEGRELLRRAAQGAIARARLAGGGGADVSRIRAYRGVFEAQLRGEWSAGAGDVTARETAFAAAQWAMSNDAAAALAKVAAAYSRAGSPVSALEARRADLQRQRAAAEDTYLALFADADRRSARDAAAATRDRLDGETRALDKQIDTADPAFGELARPTVLTSTETRALLRPGEAVLLSYTASDATYVFLLTPGEIVWHRADGFAAPAMKAAVEKLRSAMVDDLETGLDTFDPVTANNLYKALVAPFESKLAATKTLITIANDPLAALPLALLVSRPASDAAAMPEYLIDRMGVTALPALSSLRALRCLLVARDAAPAACGAARSNRPMSTPASIDFVGIGAPTLDDPEQAAEAEGLERGSPDFAKAFQGSLADTKFLLSLGKLRGAEAELATVRGKFAAGRSLVRAGDAATESLVKSMPQLGQGRFVLFSTHGLLASESGVRGEPGLVFTPPAEAAKSALDDGLLTASEAAQLKLTADFVVLSACNTATTSGEANSEGLSSLARAFFFAGARSLLVSHWYISDDSTAVLMSRLFEEQQRDRAVTRGMALRDAMLAVRAEPKWRNPAYWAAFSLVGLPN